MFRSPKRRSTRQRSGFNVAGEKSGRQVIIVRSQKYLITSPTFSMNLVKEDCSLPPQFESDFGMVGIGGYIKTTQPCSVRLSIKAIDPLDGTAIVSHEKIEQIPSRSWVKVGTSAEVPTASTYEAVTVKGDIALAQTEGLPLGEVQLFGVNLDAIEAYTDRPILEDYKKKTHLYYPEIFYFNHDEPFVVTPTEITGKIKSEGVGEQVVLKACNRCSRFLPVDIYQENNALGFSNHKRFSDFRIDNWDEVGELDDALQPRTVSSADNAEGVLQTQLGFQLECRPCKKFQVNAPLNPMRNAAQRREDSLRRRAFEQLVMKLLQRVWIFYSYRQEHGEEFNVYLWNKFDKKCFSCGKDLPTVQKMHIDHTLPLVYFWPLDETATCLCASCNSQKHELFPFEFLPYQNPGKLAELAEITGLDPDVLTRPARQANPAVVEALWKNAVWFFDEFLGEKEYQKVRHGKLTADLIHASIQRILDETQPGMNLVSEYFKQTKRYPETVTIDDE